MGQEKKEALVYGPAHWYWEPERKETEEKA